VFASDVAALGLPTAQGLVLTETWYWDMNDTNRAWTKRWQQERQGKWPTMIHAGVYAGVLHYLKTAVALKGNVGDGKAVVAQMKSMPTDDPLFGKGLIQPNGRTIHDAYLYEVKKPAESKSPWDFYKLVGKVPGDQAFTPLDKSTCALLKK
jgi:branched-chain amino acid transport system substrate-binding protein